MLNAEEGEKIKQHAFLIVVRTWFLFLLCFRNGKLDRSYELKNKSKDYFMIKVPIWKQNFGVPKGRNHVLGNTASCSQKVFNVWLCGAVFIGTTQLTKAVSL